MSADSEKVHNIFADQLASFDAQLRTTADDVDLLANVQRGISRLLLASGNSEAQIRRTLQECYESGALRKETFQLVKSMLDRFVTENVPTSATAENIPAAVRPVQFRPTTYVAPEDTDEAEDDVFSSTTVIPDDQAVDMSADGRVQVGSVLRDRYLLQQKIAGGSMGVVYKAMDRRLAEAGTGDHWVAIKVLSPKLAENGQALRALQQEAAKGRCLVHPNIVRFIDLDRDDDLYFLVMEWLDGRTLADILDSKDAASIDHKSAFRITRQIGEALEYAHSRGIVHADIKPGNIMIMPDGDAKLFDFGVARVRQQQADGQFDPGVLGAMTPAYSSMQVLTGENPVAADDVFSLSCLLYRLIAGYRVFGPRNAAEASQEGMKPQRLKALNDSQWRALKKGLSYSRVTRFNSVRDFLNALNENADEPFRVEEPDRFAEVVEQSSSSRWIAAVVVIIGLLAAVAYQQGYLQPLKDRYLNRSVVETPLVAENAPALAVSEATTPKPEVKAEEVTPEPDVQAAEFTPTAAEEVEAVSSESDVVSDNLPLATGQPAEDSGELIDLEVLPVVDEPVVQEQVVGPDPMLVDFSRLPQATEIVAFTPGRAAGRPTTVVAREDGPAVIIDFVRGSGLETAMTLRLEEVGFSGNRSPWAAGQYALSDSGLIQFPVGQTRGRVTLTMESDTIREADQQSTLRLREVAYVDSELALVNIVLEDDDQREFEARLPVNTIAFALDQVTIRERDPAVQIDIVRFNPDNAALTVGFSVFDITASEGEDYFAPGQQSISFGPGQRSARLLVPLVQDADFEGDETFVVELDVGANTPASGTNRQVVVLIRDDELPSP
ncbi:MAG: protein kinase [Gammaproteobacteria bacterium]|nr:protein kinase [Gammaproteobacteria bacterium]MDH5239840.1 protein kinase [Gammaproteobacteria bacterium]MDH5260701.1 protein kinase [Gammaproteobacteria bacterium]